MWTDFKMHLPDKPRRIQGIEWMVLRYPRRVKGIMTLNSICVSSLEYRYCFVALSCPFPLGAIPCLNVHTSLLITCSHVSDQSALTRSTHPVTLTYVIVFLFYISGLSVLVVTLVLSFVILIVYLRRSRPRKRHESEEEQHFQPDNVANYRIEGGGEEDLYQEGHLRDILKSFETADFTPCQERFKLSGNNSDVSGPCVVMAPIKKEVNGIRGCKPVQKQVKPETRETDGSFSPGGSDQEPPDTSSSPSAVSTPERRRRVRSSSRGELWERQTPEGLESGVDASPTRKLTEIFGLNEEEKEGMRSLPEGFSPPEKFSSLHKRERGNGASLQRPEKAQDCETPEQNGKHGHVLSGVEYPQENSFSMENPLSRPNSDVLTKSNGEGLPSIQRRSLPPKKPPRTGYPRGLPPQAGTFLPEDAMQRFYYEGSGSPTISLSTLGDNEVDSETDDNYEDMINMGEKFKKLARIYGVPPSVTFSPHDEFIGE